MVLIIDDDIAVQKSLALLLRQQGLESDTAGNEREALAKLAERMPDLILLDMNFTVDTTGADGLATLRRIRALNPVVPVILITGWATMELAIAGMKTGANDFIAKPWDNQHMLQSVKTALELQRPPATSKNRKQLDQQFNFEHIVGQDPAFLQVLETIGRVAATDASVLILGESGTGKELIAEAIHENSRRRQHPFVKVNLGGISTTLFESELFGHKRGAFTDARFDRKGRFEMAHTGSIFLDEIGELDLTSQVKLLRVLQDRKFEVLGSSQTRSVDIRLISATNRDLAEMVAEGNFREDLFYRINLITVKLPPLRERPGDIPLLARFYLDNLRELYDRPDLEISKTAMAWLQQYPFPGNIRELKNLVERTVLITPRNFLEVEDFRTQLSATAKRSGADDLPVVGSMTLEEMEREMIQRALDHYDQHITNAARALGLTRSALYRRLEKYGIDFER
ncbi:sigma-54-dependent transcriptional regulator [Flavilitoribacter nigricans]|uniref:Sigma-54-dependent Fis family transcriptional regulator n=1 Tax=Flavilitoribacter nigricans (strain ATCC 23147 / DSM 23189 / NBRC 102662 / NCIMB 1420 / SS-2) TaxID=1122177 RepID=A0A2D0NAL7_FLAN2|nr:sigma-54 dependent transcriptional regulator [Flavilitoribacter nigricans]PHN04823.1 sigma-54-dependent Fis family transcriptional regulator [Flavilitoribacter nigricans DSM 23189 = NBRC 102662]